MAKVAAMASDVGALEAENADLRAFFERALAEAEALKRENAELRKANQDIQLDQQLVKALNETEKLKAAADAYKKELLQQKLAEKEWDLQQAQDRTKDLEKDNNSLSSTIAELRLRQQDKEAQLDHLRRENAKLREEVGSLEHASPSKSDAEPALDEGKAKEAEEIANQLQELGPGRVDTQLLVAAAKALRDITVLEKQLKRAREEKERLQADVAELNDTVFSKSFKAPSAWAEREVKYKMEKRDWESKVEKLRVQLRGLQAENAAYRAASKTSEMEERIVVLQARIAAVEEEKVAAQKAHHELQLQIRNGSFQLERSAHVAHVKDGGPVMQIVEHLSEVGAPSSDLSRAASMRTPRRRPAGASAGGDGDDDGLLDSPSVVEGMIMDYDEKGIGPGAKRDPRVSTPTTTRIFDTGRPADVIGGTPVGNEAVAGDGLANRMAGFGDQGQGSAAPSPEIGGPRNVLTPGASPMRSTGTSANVSPRVSMLPEHTDGGAGGPSDTSTAHGMHTPLGPSGVMASPAASPGPAGAARGGDPESSEWPEANAGVDARVGAGAHGGAAATPPPASSGVTAGMTAMAGMSRRSSDMMDEMEWTPERLRELEADKAQVARALGDHAADNDVGSLRWRVAELESVAEMYVVQLQKMAVALERADQEKSMLEQELEAARGQKKETNFAAHAQDRLLALLSGRRPDEEAAERLREAEGMLQDSYRERGVLQRKVDSLERRLTAIAHKINAGLVPDEGDLEAGPSATMTPSRVTEDGGTLENGFPPGGPSQSMDGSSQAGGGPVPDGGASPTPMEPPARAVGGVGARRRRNMGGVIAGLSEEEVEVMRLREENENLMHTVVRTKIELAETQGEYLKAKRALLRSVEKQVGMAERMESLKSAVADGNLAGAEQLLIVTQEPEKGLGGDIESLGERDLF